MWSQQPIILRHENVTALPTFERHPSHYSSENGEVYTIILDNTTGMANVIFWDRHLPESSCHLFPHTSTLTSNSLRRNILTSCNYAENMSSHMFNTFCWLRTGKQIKERTATKVTTDDGHIIRDKSRASCDRKHQTLTLSHESIERICNTTTMAATQSVAHLQNPTVGKTEEFQ